MAARTRTLPAAIAHVLGAPRLAGSEGDQALAFDARWWQVFIQIADNLSNDIGRAPRVDTEEPLGRGA